MPREYEPFAACHVHWNNIKIVSFVSWFTLDYSDIYRFVGDRFYFTNALPGMQIILVIDMGSCRNERCIKISWIIIDFFLENSLTNHDLIGKDTKIEIPSTIRAW